MAEIVAIYRNILKMYHLLYVMVKQRRCCMHGNREIADTACIFHEYALYPDF